MHRAMQATSSAAKGSRWPGPAQAASHARDHVASSSTHAQRLPRCQSLWSSESQPAEDSPTVELPTDALLEPFQGARKPEGGYTPHEFVIFTDRPLRHEVTVTVAVPRAAVYEAWQEPLNWLEWFSPIDQMAFHEDNPDLVTMYLWYRWARTPYLELFSTLRRTRSEEGVHMLWEPAEGAPLVAALLLEDAPGGGTRATLRLSYLIPKVLWEFAGSVAVYGDVDDLLRGCMESMARYLEAVDPQELRATRAADRKAIAEGFPEQRRLQQEDIARRAASRHPAPWAGGGGGEEESGGEELEAASDDDEEGAAPQQRVTPIERDADGALVLNPAAARARRRWRPAP